MSCPLLEGGHSLLERTILFIRRSAEGARQLVCRCPLLQTLFTKPVAALNLHPVIVGAEADSTLEWHVVSIRARSEMQGQEERLSFYSVQS